MRCGTWDITDFGITKPQLAVLDMEINRVFRKGAIQS